MEVEDAACEGLAGEVEVVAGVVEGVVGEGEGCGDVICGVEI